MPDPEEYRSSLRLEYSNMRRRFLRFLESEYLLEALDCLDPLIQRYDALTLAQYELYQSLHDDDVDDYLLYASEPSLTDDDLLKVLERRLDLAEALA